LELFSDKRDLAATRRVFTRAFEIPTATVGQVDMDDARELRRRWKEKGSPPCDHRDLDREYFNQRYPPRNPDRAHTGDQVCTRCGKEFPT
jgi:hypothetical protein